MEDNDLMIALTLQMEEEEQRNLAQKDADLGLSPDIRELLQHFDRYRTELQDILLINSLGFSSVTLQGVF